MAATVYPNGDVSFVYRPAPAAREVFLAGSFSGWVLGARRMQKSDDGTFRARLPLPAGTHRYRFIVDGQWVADPEARTQQPNALGTVDSVVCVAAVEGPSVLSDRLRFASSARARRGEATPGAK